MPGSQPGQMTFTTRMQDPEDITYPSWLQTDGKKDNPPRKRARQIYRSGTESTEEESCTNCIGLKRPCIRAIGQNFGKCCSCTLHDLHPEEMCHTVAGPGPELGKMKPTAIGKMKQIEKEIAKVQRQAAHEESVNESGFGEFQASLTAPASTHSAFLSAPSVPLSSVTIPRSVPARDARSYAPSPESGSMQLERPVLVAGPANSGLDATLERITVLENQVAQLEANLLKLRVKIQEIESSVAITPTILPPIADDSLTANRVTKKRKLSVMEVGPSMSYTPSIRSPFTERNALRRPSTMNIHKIMNQTSLAELPAGPALLTPAKDSDGGITPKHSLFNSVDYTPDGYASAHSDQAYDADSDMTDAN